MKKAALSLLFIFCFALGFSTENPKKHTTLLSGKIVDKETGEALAGVKIQVKGSNVVSYTDMNGSFAFAINNESGNEVTINLVGYAPLTLKSSVFTASPEISLSPR